MADLLKEDKRSKKVGEAILAVQRGEILAVAVKGFSRDELAEFMHRYPFSYEDDDKRATVAALIRIAH